MQKPIEIRSGSHLLFVVNADGHIECLRDGWLHVVDIIETLRTGHPVVHRRYVGKSRQIFNRKDDVLTNVDACATITHSN